MQREDKAHIFCLCVDCKNTIVFNDRQYISISHLACLDFMNGDLYLITHNISLCGGLRCLPSITFDPSLLDLKAWSFDVRRSCHGIFTESFESDILGIFTAGLESNFLRPSQTTSGDIAMYLHPQGLTSMKQSPLRTLGVRHRPNRKTEFFYTLKSMQWHWMIFFEKTI